MKVSWVFDVISPFAYLGLKQMHELPARVELEYKPVLLAGLLAHHGQLGPAEMPTKRRFTYRFALWRSRRTGIKMQMPPAHPFNPLAALRLIIAAGCSFPAVELVFDAIFQHGLDATDPKVIERLGVELGIKDPMAAINDATVKEVLRQNTDWAIAKGIFGVPTFLVGEEIFWGHDAFEMLLGYLRDPAAFDDQQMRALDSLPIGARRSEPPRQS
ncbi:MAG TPA: 2-hydroxychromene-2-carboxylate isomerase [Steroidobacteraceae bacterium]